MLGLLERIIAEFKLLHKEMERNGKQEGIKKAIDALVAEVIEELREQLGSCLESITVVGSYGVGRISLERPNVNLFVFVNRSVSSKDIRKFGEIFQDVSKRHCKYFSIKIDAFPFRSGIPIGKGDLQLVLSPRILFMSEKDHKPPFGIPSNVLEGMKSTRKIVFGTDPLEKVNLGYSKRDLLQWALFNIGILFKNMLVLTPLIFDANKHSDLLVVESIGFGKNSLTWGIEIFLDEEELKKGKHIELISDKEKMVSFYQNVDKELGEAARIILEARTSFLEYKKDKAKATKLFDAAYVAVNKVYLKVLNEMKNIKPRL